MSDLRMVRQVIALDRLRELSRIHGLWPDEGRLLHHALSECFGKRTIQPFRLLPGRNGSNLATLYGYCSRSEEELKSISAKVAPPEFHELFSPATLQLKSMPREWIIGQRLAFDLRVVPVRRLMRPILPWPDQAARSKPYAKGAELDVYLVDAMRKWPSGIPQGVERAQLRQDLYLAWLAERLRAAAELVPEASRVASSRRITLRRGKSRQDRPEAIIHGELLVTDSQAFIEMLTRGVGRHAAYGFGMLLLRPPHTAV